MLRDDVINCTNANSEQVMVLYKSDLHQGKLFVREKNEFYLKFKEMSI